jgi:6-pyruvoyl-tetrahydropterin synthase
MAASRSKCSRQHGHNYKVEVVLTAPALEDPGFVTDFGDLAGFKSRSVLSTSRSEVPESGESF